MPTCRHLQPVQIRFTGSVLLHISTETPMAVIESESGSQVVDFCHVTTHCVINVMNTGLLDVFVM